MGARLARCLKPNLTIYMQGNLGAGKTTFVRGLIHALGYTGKVKSPTYTLLEPYVLPQFSLNHFDLYRFMDEEEWDAAGFREYFNASSVCIVEWPEKAGHLLPAADIVITLVAIEASRSIQLAAYTNAGKACLESLSV